jgi:methyl-accepting chemotaxis protein
MQILDNQTILLAFVVVIGLAALLQTIFLLAIFVSVRKAARAIREETEKLCSSLMPVIYDARDSLASTRDILANTQEFLTNAQEFFGRVAPNLEAAAADLAEITQGLRLQSLEVQSSAQEILERVRMQSNRLDEMFTSLLDTVDRAGGFVAEVVTRPVRQISSVLRSAKAIIESLRGHGAQR